MIDVKQAVQIAREKAVEMLGQPAIRLEEIEKETYKGAEVWSITLSLPRAPAARSPYDLTASPIDYKRFLVDAETGQFVAMKIREIAA